MGLCGGQYVVVQMQHMQHNKDSMMYGQHNDGSMSSMMIMGSMMVLHSKVQQMDEMQNDDR